LTKSAPIIYDINGEEVQMKKRIPLTLIICLLMVIVSLLLAETLTVKVQSTSLRNTPKFYAQAVQPLNAGEKLEKIAAQGGWLQVRTSGGVVGWVHSSAVEVPKFDLMASGKGLKPRPRRRGGPGRERVQQTGGGKLPGQA
jgi:hypothetical protein